MAENARTTSFSFHAQFNTPSSTFHIFCVFPSYTSRQFNASISTMICSVVYFMRLQFITSVNQSISFVIPVLIAFLQVKYQGNEKKSPFSTHPTIMFVAVSSSVVYSLAYITLLRFPLSRFAVVAHHCLLWLGYTSVASLASVLFPDLFSPFVFGIFALLSAAESLYLLYHKLPERAHFQVRRRGVRRFLINNIWNSSRQWQQILPI